MSEIVVTQAKRGDGKRIAQLLKEWVHASALPWPAVQDEPMLEWVLHTIEHGYVVVAEQHERLVGAVGIQPCYLPWNVDVAMMRDAFFYVPRARGDSPNADAQARARNAAKRVPGVVDALLTALKLYCAKRRLPMILEVMPGVDIGTVDEWYGLKGGRYCGGVYVFGLEG